MWFYCILLLPNIFQPQKHFLPPPKPWGTYFIANFPDRTYFAENPVFLDYAKQMLRFCSVDLVRVKTDKYWTLIRLKNRLKDQISMKILFHI